MSTRLRVVVGSVLVAIGGFAPLVNAEYCIRNAYAGGYLSDVANKLWEKCGKGEKWALEKTGDHYCLRNIYTGKYLSDNVQHYETCSTGEKWKITGPAQEICMQNVHTGQYLSDKIEAWWPRCGKGEKWVLERQGAR